MRDGADQNVAEKYLPLGVGINKQAHSCITALMINSYIKSSTKFDGAFLIDY